MKTACLDIGGTFLKSGVLENGMLTQISELPTQSKNAAEVLAMAFAAVRTMHGVGQVGISTAGEVDENGVIRLSDNIPGYTGMPVRERAERELHLPVVVENDVNSAAVGESVFGAGRGASDFLMLTFGTGVGGAVFLGGRLYKGADCSAGEFGGLLTHPEDCVPDDVGSGSYERYASTSALVRRARELDSSLDSGRVVFEAAARPEVLRLVDDWIREIAFGLAGLIHCFNPALLILGGGILREPIILETLHRILPSMVKPSFRAFRLVRAELGNTAGLLGAGWLAERSRNVS